MKRISLLSGNRAALRVGCMAAFGLLAASAQAASPPYPFEGIWIRAGHACNNTAVPARIYTSKDVTYAVRDVTAPRGHCSITRVTSGSGVYELTEECRRGDRSQNHVTEIIRLMPPDSLTLKRQVSRLKIPATQRMTRCSAAAVKPVPAKPAR